MIVAHKLSGAFFCFCAVSCGDRFNFKMRVNKTFFNPAFLDTNHRSMVTYTCIFNTPLRLTEEMRSTAEKQGAPKEADRLGIVEPLGFNMPIISFWGGL